MPSRVTARALAVWRDVWMRLKRELAPRLMRLRAHPRLRPEPEPMRDPNTFFSRSALKSLRGHVYRAANADERLLTRFAEPRIEGLRAWEYGVLLAYLDRSATGAPWRHST